MYKIIVWGFGGCYNRMRNTITYFEYTHQIRIVAIADKSAYMKMLDGYRVITPDEILSLDWDYIIVMTDKGFDAIVSAATKDYNIKREKLVPYRILLIPGLSLNTYFRLRESNISIISNNCWGGLAYHTLGIECLSPFKNLFLNDEDYLHIISNLEKYMQLEPMLSRYEKEPHSGIQYPVLTVGDVEIHCNHTTCFKEAIGDWNRRKKKINYENLFFEMYTTNGDTADTFVNQIGDHSGICFVPWKTDDRRMLTLETGSQQTEFWEVVNANASLGTNGLKYQLVDLLSGNISLRYHL